MARPIAAALVALACSGAPRGPPGGGALLVLENPERGRRVAVALAAGEGFTVTSQHSMYDAPLTETFTVGADGWIALRRVSSPSAAVREYLGITAPGEEHAVERVMPELVFRVAAGAPQRLRAGTVELSFLELGERGDRLVLRAAAAPARAGGGEAVP